MASTYSLSIRRPLITTRDARDAEKLSHPDDHFTACVISSDGDRLITVSGADKRVRILDAAKVAENDEEEDLVAMCKPHAFLQACVAVDTKDNYIVAASNEARLLDLTTGDCIKTLIRMPLPVRAIAFCPSKPGKPLSVAIAGDDLTLKIIEVEDITKVSVLEVSDQIKSMAFSPDGNTLATASDDGALRIYTFKSDKELVCEHTLKDSIPQTKPESKDLCRVSWHPSGKYLAVPGRKRDIDIYDTSRWKVVKNLEGHTE
ncbi:hypothetical protein HDV05_008494, partial [Chytridiales sp. JEL 0842]